MNGPDTIKTSGELISGDFTAAGEPLGLFAAWLAEAEKSEPNDPNAMALATVDGDGLPDVRMVLLKGYDTDGFVFYSHIDSAKGRELAANPWFWDAAALLGTPEDRNTELMVQAPFDLSKFSDAKLDEHELAVGLRELVPGALL